MELPDLRKKCSITGIQENAKMSPQRLSSFSSQ